METKHKISIPEPCHEDWDKMTPDETGRFCNSCSKSVVDFTEMLPIEIQEFFIKNEGQKVCGRFKKKQLDSIIIQIPNQVLLSQVHYHKMFLLALFITMGTTLFSCKQENGDKQKIDKVEVVKNISEVERILVGDTKFNPNDSTHIPPPPPPKINQVKFVKPYNKNLISTKQCKSINEVRGYSVINSIREVEYLYDNDILGSIAIDTYPEFPGGLPKLESYLIKNFTFSKKSRKSSGTIVATFVIRKDGSLDSTNISKDLGLDTKDELIKILRKSPKWSPGKQNGKYIDCHFQLSLLIEPDTVKKSFFRTKIKSKIKTIEIKRMTIYEND